MVILTFEVAVDCDDESADEFGDEMAHWLEDSWFNGEDIVGVSYVGKNRVRKLENELNTYKSGNRLLKATLDGVRKHE